MKLYIEVVLTALILIKANIVSGILDLECFMCVYDPQKPARAVVWNAIRLINDTNNPDCYKPDRYNPGSIPLQRCTAKGSCNIQTWHLGNSYDWYVARGCDDVCYNEVWPNVDRVPQGYNRVDIQFHCCKDDRCNGASGLILTSLPLIITSASAMLSFW